MTVTINGTSGITTPGVNSTGSNVLGDNVADTLNVGNGAIVTNSSGNVGIGTSSPGYALDIRRGTGADAYILLAGNNGGTSSGILIGQDSSGASQLYQFGANPIKFAINGSERMRIDSSGNLLFNSGYGSVATAYGCRAWVNFNGTSTVAIRASGNVSSITDNGTGDYTVNFTNAMPDANYSVVGSTRRSDGTTDVQAIFVIKSQTTYPLTASSARVTTGYSTNSAAVDFDTVCTAIFR